MVPGIIMMVLVLIPAVMTALGVVREKELGSITNLYVTPTTGLEFLLGKQLPYVAIALVNFISLVVLAVVLFEVPVKGSLAALVLGATLYVFATTAFGLFISSFVRTQIAGIFAAAILATLPASSSRTRAVASYRAMPCDRPVRAVLPAHQRRHLRKALEFSRLWRFPGAHHRGGPAHARPARPQQPGADRHGAPQQHLPARAEGLVSLARDAAMVGLIIAFTYAVFGPRRRADGLRNLRWRSWTRTARRCPPASPMRCCRHSSAATADQAGRDRCGDGHQPLHLRDRRSHASGPM
jgi:hypothetical protein